MIAIVFRCTLRGSKLSFCWPCNSLHRMCILHEPLPYLPCVSDALVAAPGLRAQGPCFLLALSRVVRVRRLLPLVHHTAVAEFLRVLPVLPQFRPEVVKLSVLLFLKLNFVHQVNFPSQGCAFQSPRCLHRPYLGHDQLSEDLDLCCCGGLTR